MNPTITALYAGLLAILYPGLSINAWCFVMTRRNMPLRVAGMALTFTALVFGALLCLSVAFGLIR